MGADIHAFVESKTEYGYMDTIAELHLPRDYYMFGLLAGVRGPYGPVFNPRGLPDKVGWATRVAYYLFALSEKDMERYQTPADVFDQGVDGAITPEQAAKYLEYGSTYMPSNERYITHPDWHTPSHLSAREYERVMSEYRRLVDDAPPRTYLAVADFLYAIPESRIVFWFDS